MVNPRGKERTGTGMAGIPELGKTCKDCEFFRFPESKEDAGGLCLRFPPMWRTIEKDDEINYFPLIHTFTPCGEFQDRKEWQIELDRHKGYIS